MKKVLKLSDGIGVDALCHLLHTSLVHLNAASSQLPFCSQKKNIIVDALRVTPCMMDEQ